MCPVKRREKKKKSVWWGVKSLSTVQHPLLVMCARFDSVSGGCCERGDLATAPALPFSSLSSQEISPILSLCLLSVTCLFLAPIARLGCDDNRSGAIVPFCGQLAVGQNRFTSHLRHPPRAICEGMRWANPQLQFALPYANCKIVAASLV